MIHYRKSCCFFPEILRLERCNELSAERLHAVGSWAAGTGPNHTAVYVSHNLRKGELERFTMQELAAACSRVRMEFDVLNEYQLWSHPFVEAWRKFEVAKGRPLHSGRCGSYKVVRQAFYKVDIPSLFEKHGKLHDTINNDLNYLYAEKLKLLPDEVPCVKLATTTDVQLADALFCKYVYKYWLSTATTNALYGCAFAIGNCECICRVKWVQACDMAW